jgi:tetratricopeptide (TPR) repeat protein
VTPLLFLAAAAAATPAPPPPPKDPTAIRYESCVALVKSDPAKAEALADQWRLGGGGLPARQCLGLAYVAQERYAPAAIAFEQAAQEAEIQRDGRAANLWVMAGNALLANGDAAGGREKLDRALALPVLSLPMRGEAYLDRARAQEALDNLPASRADLDMALKLVPQDPMAWLLSATLARKMHDMTRATTDIAEAQKRAPNDGDVEAEARAIAGMGKAVSAIAPK